MREQKTIGFIGAGNMAGAMIRGLVKGGLPGKRILAFDVDRNKLKAISREYRIRSARSNAELIGQCGTAVLAVKPQVVDAVLHEIGPLSAKAPLVLSIAAGVTISALTSTIPTTLIDITTVSAIIVISRK